MDAESLLRTPPTELTMTPIPLRALVVRKAAGVSFWRLKCLALHHGRSGEAELEGCAGGDSSRRTSDFRTYLWRVGREIRTRSHVSAEVIKAPLAGESGAHSDFFICVKM